MSKRLNAVPALLAALGGVGLYYLGSDVSVVLAFVAGGVAVLLGWLLLFAGRRSLPATPVKGVWLMSGWILGLVALGAAAGAALVAAGIAVTEALSSAPESEGSEVGGFITGALATFAGTIFTKDVDEGSGDIWPGAKTKAAMATSFKDKFKAESRAFEAVYNERVRGDPGIEGWGMKARRDRARIIATELKKDG